MVVRAQQPQFRAAVDLIQLDVVVLDKNRQPIRDLAAADFTILEDGKPRPVAAFAPVVLPDVTSATGTANAKDRAPWTREVPPDVVDNHRTDAGRLVVILMDRSILTGPQTVAARRIAHAAIDALGPDDLGAVVYDSGFSNEGRQQGFTSSRARLHQAVDKPFMGWTAAGMEMTGGGLQHGNPLSKLEESPDCLCGLCVFDALENIADAMREVRTRQKVLLFVGYAILIQDPPMSASHLCSIRPYRERALRALDLANVTVHTLDTAGLESLATTAEYKGGADRPLSPAQEMIRKGDLDVIPGHTGGRTVLNTNNPEDLIPAIFRETRAYYVLGFQRANPVDDGKVHEIKVRVNRPGATVRSRSAYYAPLPTSRKADPTPLEAALEGGLPDTSIPLSLGLTSFALDNESAGVAIQLRVPASFTEHRFEGQSTVLDARGHVVTSEKYAVAFDAPQTDAIDVVTHVGLKPGQYEIRVAAQAGDRVSSVYGYVDVPPVHKDKLWLSDLLIEDGSTPVMPSAETSQLLSAAPTVRRSFTATDPIVVAVQVRAPQVERATDASGRSARLRVLDDKNRVAAESAMAFPSDAADGLSWMRMPLPAGRLEPGNYLIELTAGAAQDAVTRRLRVTIR